eukprot:Nitzschia sp. Nitz4//scaffold104_size75438//48394//49740//NITZ4_005661-RA/size75438-exonerate_est2genome-gene-0.54-mRNA-1//-1//CDS//3329532401//3191//frame0
MDLLGGYNSDSSDDESPSNVPGGSAPLNMPSTADTTESLPGVAKEIPRSSDATSTVKPNRKGKKLLRLQAVLPQHIWNQLTNDAAGDADSDDEQTSTRIQKPVKQQAASDTSKKTSALREDSGNLRPKFLSSTPQADTELSGLLMALPKTKGSTSSSSSILRPVTDATNDFPTATTTAKVDIPETSQFRPTSSSTLGAAFLSVSTQVTRKRKDGSKAKEVQDIHAPPAATPSTASVHDIAPTPSPATASTSVSASSASWSIPRPTAATVHARTAAPSVRSSAPMPRPPQPPSSMSYQGTPQGVASYAPAPQPAAAGAVPNHSKKSRKRQMEAMLRAGNLSEIESDVHIAPPDASGSLPTGSETAASTVNIHGVRVVPTTSYQVGAGGMTASTSVSGKQRGKNQLSALLVNAASLESKRKEQALFPTNLDGGAQNGRQKRANAKRKYGW